MAAFPRRLQDQNSTRDLTYEDVVGQVRREIATSPDVDRAEIRKALRMTDREREAYYLASNANMLRLLSERP